MYHHCDPLPPSLSSPSPPLTSPSPHNAQDSKASRPTSIGRFGLGFNAVYHFTDLPAFVSGDHLVLFDPHAKYLPVRGRGGLGGGGGGGGGGGQWEEG